MLCWLLPYLFLMNPLMTTTDSKPIVGRWQGSCSGGYHDNLTYGAYEYEFTEDHKVTASMRYYMDPQCKGEGFDDGPKSEGSYTLSKRLSWTAQFRLRIDWEKGPKGFSRGVRFPKPSSLELCDGLNCELFQKRSS